MPDFGGLGDENSLKLRNYIWRVCGFVEGEQQAKDKPVAQTKKNALVILYRLWSAFSKNMRYIISQKGNSVSL